MKRLTFLLIPLLALLLCSAKPPTEQNLHVYRYLNLIESDATTISNMFGIPKELIISQAMQETGFGISYVCLHYCNHFGIKNGFYDSQFECFLRYAEILVSSKCYQNLEPKTIDQYKYYLMTSPNETTSYDKTPFYYVRFCKLAGIDPKKYDSLITYKNR